MQIVKYIDQIAREKNRDVLFVTFHTKKYDGYNYEENPNRKKFIKFLEKNNLQWSMCGDIANELGWRSYRGQIYIDVPNDINNKDYKKLSSYLENENGTLKNKNIKFWYLSLEIAIKNKHHDEPGFWENWAENF